MQVVRIFALATLFLGLASASRATPPTKNLAAIVQRRINVLNFYISQLQSYFKSNGSVNLPPDQAGVLIELLKKITMQMQLFEIEKKAYDKSVGNYNALIKANENLYDRIQTLQRQNQSIKTFVSSVKEKNTNLTKALSDTRSKLKAETLKLQNYKSQMESAKVEIKELDETPPLAMNEDGQLKSLHELASADLERLKDAANEKANALAKVKALEDQLASYRAATTDLEEKHAVALAKIASLEQEIFAANSRHSDLSHQHAENLATNAALLNKQSQDANEVARLQIELDQIKAAAPPKNNSTSAVFLTPDRIVAMVAVVLLVSVCVVGYLRGRARSRRQSVQSADAPPAAVVVQDAPQDDEVKERSRSRSRSPSRPDSSRP